MYNIMRKIVIVSITIVILLIIYINPVFAEQSNNTGTISGILVIYIIYL